MDSVIESVLNNEEYTTNEERIEALKKGLAPVVIPKDKFNSVNDKLKESEKKCEDLTNDFDAYKKSKMTEDEKAQAEKEQLEKDKKANAIEKSSLAVQKLLLQNGIEVKDDDEDLKGTLENIVSEDYDKSINLAKSFISLMNKTKETAEQETTTKLIGETPKPVGGTTSSQSVSKLDQLKEELKTAIENKDDIAQARLYAEIAKEEKIEA